jgi:hypothetical protein
VRGTTSRASLASRAIQVLPCPANTPIRAGVSYQLVVGVGTHRKTRQALVALFEVLAVHRSVHRRIAVDIKSPAITQHPSDEKTLNQHEEGGLSIDPASSSILKKGLLGRKEIIDGI